MTLPEIAIRRPIATLMVLISLAVLGGVALTRMPLGFLPDADEPRLFVIVDYPNASPPTVERTVLRPLEEALASLEGIRHMWSSCDASGGRVMLNFRWDVNVGMLRVEVRDRVDRLLPDLPEGIERIHVSGNWDASESGETILEARLSSGRDLSRDYELLDRKIIRPLRRIPGVAQVSLDGVDPAEVRINLDLDALRRHRVDPRTVLAQLRANNEDRTLGVLRGDAERQVVRVAGTLGDVAEIRDLVLNPEGLRLEDIAEVTYREPPHEYGRHLDGRFAIGVSVAKEASANTVEISDEIHRRVARMGEDPELAGIRFLVWEDQGREIRRTLRDLRNTGVLGAILASVVLLLFLRRLTTTLTAVVCIPFSLVVACGVIWAQGKSLNTLTLLGLIVGVGMLVDNAVVMMENIDRYQRQGLKRRIAALVGSREVSVAVMAATLTSVIVFVPLIFSPKSEMNIYLRELGLTVSYTLLASLFISQTLIPLVVSRWVRTESPPHSRWMTALQGRYARLLGFTLRHRWLAPVVGLGVIGSAVYPFLRIDKNFEANPREMFVAVHYKIEQNLSLDRKEELVSSVEAQLEPYRRELHVDSVYSFWSDRWVMTRIYLQDGHTSEEDFARVRARLREVVPRMPGVQLEVMDSGRFWERNRGKRVAFKLTGEDSEVLAELAAEAKQRIARIPALSDAYSTAQEGREEIHALVDRDRARAYGVPVQQPAEVVELTFRGRRLPRFRGPDGEVEMRLLLDQDSVRSLSDLENLPLLRGEGATVPLASIADFEIVRAPDEISRDERVTGVWVGARYEGGVKEEHQAAARAALASMELPYGYKWDFQASERDRGDSQREFLINLALVLGLVFAVMAGLFESVRQALSLLVSLPFAMAGAVWTLYLTSTDFDQPASVGLLLLLGVVVNNGIVMVEHINQYRRKGMAREAAMLRGGGERLRPVIMTAVTTLLGLVPILIERPSLAGVYYYSMALVLMGGLVVSTFLTTILLPTTICLTEDALAWIGGLPLRTLRRARRVARGREAAPARDADAS